MNENARGIQSVEVGGRILRALVQAGKPKMLKDIAEAADIKPAQCHAYLTSLRTVGLVHQDSATGLYELGSFALRLGVRWLQGNPLSAHAINGLKALTEEYGVMSLITAWGQFGPTIVHIYAGLSQAALNLRQGSVFSVVGTANGRVFAAYMGGEEIETQVRAELSQTSNRHSLGAKMTMAEFAAQVSPIREVGYSVAREAPIPGVNAIAVPIFDAAGKLAFSASLIGASDKLKVDPDSPVVQRMLDLTRQAAVIAGGQRALAHASL